MGASVLVLAAACGSSKGSESAPSSTAAALSATAASADSRVDLFVQKGCPQCHSISALGVKSAQEVGPDLTLAYEDVQSRFGVKLDEFLQSPTGTMQVVLGSMIQLTPAERDSIVHILKRLHEAREEREEHETKPS